MLDEREIRLERERNGRRNGRATRAMSGTAALPEINWQSTQIERPGPNTERAMVSGVIAGVAGGIDRLIGVYCDFAGHSSDGVRVVLTGGDGAAISSHLSHNHQQHGNLVCRAVLDLPRS